MKFFNLALLAGCLCSSYGAGIESGDLPVEAHLHRIMARYELDSSKFTGRDVSWCANILFMNAEEEGNLSRMAAILNFFKDEDFIPADLGKWRERLFEKTPARKFGYSHIGSAFKIKFK